MKKLSKLLKRPSLVLFDNVLDSAKVLTNPEVRELVKAILGNDDITVAEVEDPEKLQDWLRDEQYKSFVGDRSMIYLYKQTKFEDLADEKCSDEYSGPLSSILFSPDADKTVITICCHWQDGALPIRNDEAIVGVIAILPT